MRRPNLVDKSWDEPIGVNAKPLDNVPPELLDLIPGFLERRQNDVEELGLFLATRDFEEIKAIGHRLKGSGSSYGLPIVSYIGKELEAGAAEGDAQRVALVLGELAKFTEQLKEALIQTDNN